MKILGHRTCRAYKKAEKDEYKILVEHTNESLKDVHEMVANIAEENKRLLNELKEMEDKMKEMDSLKMLQSVQAERLQLDTMHEILLKQLEGKPAEHNLPYMDRRLLPDFANPQMCEVGANEAPNTVLDVEASTSSTARNNEENMRLQKQVYELKEDVQALKNQIYGPRQYENH